MTRDERKEAAREFLQELADQSLDDLIDTIQRSEANEVLQYDRIEIVDLISGEWKRYAKR